MSIIPIVVQQHAEEAAFLWFLRDHAIRQPHYSLKDLASLDERIDAHVDGLRVAGEPGWKLCQQELSWNEPGEIFAAAFLALDSERQDRIDQVLELALTAPELESGLISAMGWTSLPSVVRQLDAFLASKQPAVRRIGLAGYAVRRLDPGPLLARFLKDDHPRVRTRALKAVGELGRGDLLPTVLQSIRDSDAECRFYAAWAAALCGQRYVPIMQTLIEFAQRPGLRQHQALAMALRSLDVPAAKAWLQRMGPVPATLRLATIGIGVLGDPEMMGVLIELMKNDAVARVAGESFSMITGVDLAYDDLERTAPDGFESGPTEDAADEDVALDEDENLPWPNPQLVADWWTTHHTDFQPGHRHLCGREINVESLCKTLVDGTQRQRAAAALELALLQPNQPLFDVRARGNWQQVWLKS